MMRRAIIIACLCGVVSSAWAGFTYYSPVTVNSGQVPSTQTDFPVLISVTDARFKTIANGGHVENGFDIRPYTDGPPTTAITGYELERYDATTGEVVMWVKRSSLDDGNVTYLAYGDAALNTDGSSTTTWSNSFLGVYHLKDGTTLNVTDSTGANNGTNNGVTATTGQIDGAGGFAAGSSQFVNVANTLSYTALTYSAWVNGTSFPGTLQTVLAKDGGGDTDLLLVKSNGKLLCRATGTGGSVQYDGTGSNTLSPATWYYLTLTYDITTGLTGYVNAGVDGTVAPNGLINAGVAPTAIGKDVGAAGRYWNGVIDEARVSDVARSANWITTEYNEGFPNTFETLGIEIPIVAPPTAFGLLIDASGKLLISADTKLIRVSP